MVGDAIAEDTGVCAAIVESRDGAETFLACCVPYLETYDLTLLVEAHGKGRRAHAIAFGVDDALGEKGRADRACCAGGRELVLYEAVDEGSFAYALRAEDYDLCFEGLGHFEGGLLRSEGGRVWVENGVRKRDWDSVKRIRKVVGSKWDKPCWQYRKLSAGVAGDI